MGEEYYRVEDQRFLGDEEFAQKLKRKVNEEETPRPKKQLSVLFRSAARAVGVDAQVIEGADRGWKVSQSRALIGYVLIRRLGYKLKDVTKCLGRDVATAPGEFAFLDQIEQVVLDFPLADLIGTAPVILRQPPHCPEIALAGSHRHATQHHVLVHPLAQCAHLLPPSIRSLGGHSPLRTWHEGRTKVARALQACRQRSTDRQYRHDATSVALETSTALAV